MCLNKISGTKEGDKRTASRKKENQDEEARKKTQGEDFKEKITKCKNMCNKNI